MGMAWTEPSVGISTKPFFGQTMNTACRGLLKLFVERRYVPVVLEYPCFTSY
jgi:hypothetical protein